MKTHSLRRRLAAACAVSAAVVVGVAGCTSTSDDSSAGSSAAVDPAALGEPNQATGTPVTIGFISDGKTGYFDNTDEITGAQTAVSYINDYLGGLNGHPIDLKVCVAHGNPAEATDCANQMVTEQVPVVLEGAMGTVDATIDVLTKAQIPLVLHYLTSPKTLTTPGVWGLMNGNASNFGAPAEIAKDEGIDKAAIVTIDVPAAVAGANNLGKLTFANAGAETDVVTIAPGVPDPTSQITAASQDDPGIYSVLGTADFCAPVIKSIRSVAPEATISVIDRCIDPGASKSIPGGYEGVRVGTTVNLDPATDDVKLLAAALDKYSDGTAVSATTGYGWAPLLGFARAMNAAEVSDLTPETVKSGLASAPAQEYPLTDGITFQCNGEAFPLSKNDCSVGGIRATANEDGSLRDYQSFNDPSLFTFPSS